MSNQNEQDKVIPPIINFVTGGISGMAATCVVHPMDVIKNRLQMHKKKASIMEIITSVYRKEGIAKFYTGLSAGLVRQATYTTVRLGIYNHLQDYWRQRNVGTPGFITLAFMAGTAGGIGALIGTPADIALVRMTTDGRLPDDAQAREDNLLHGSITVLPILFPEQQRKYKSILDALIRIVKEEGLFALWRGSMVTVGRAIVVNVSQLATYSQVKHLIATQMRVCLAFILAFIFGYERPLVTNFHEANVTEGLTLHFCASMISGFLTTFNSMPFDITKTRIQSMKSKGKPPSMFSVMISIARNEGIGALWKGFWPNYCRIGPHTVLTLIINEQLIRLYKMYYY